MWWSSVYVYNEELDCCVGFSFETREMVQRTRRWLDSTITSIDSEDAKIIEEVRSQLTSGQTFL